MGNAVKVNIKALETLRNNLVFTEQQVTEIVTVLTKDIASLLLRKVIKRTPVGDYSNLMEGYNDKLGGDLRRGWTVGDVQKEGNKYIIEVINSIEYASYVEFGHMQTPGRYVPAIGKKLKKAWVPGRFMLTISEKEIKDNLQPILSSRIERALKKVLNGK